VTDCSKPAAFNLVIGGERPLAIGDEPGGWQAMILICQCL